MSRGHPPLFAPSRIEEPSPKVHAKKFKNAMKMETWFRGVGTDRRGRVLDSSAGTEQNNSPIAIAISFGMIRSHRD